jgi:hypothetical protein
MANRHGRTRRRVSPQAWWRDMAAMKRPRWLCNNPLAKPNGSSYTRDKESVLSHPETTWQAYLRTDEAVEMAGHKATRRNADDGAKKLYNRARQRMRRALMRKERP